LNLLYVLTNQLPISADGCVVCDKDLSAEPMKANKKIWTVQVKEWSGKNRRKLNRTFKNVVLYISTATTIRIFLMVENDCHLRKAVLCRKYNDIFEASASTINCSHSSKINLQIIVIHFILSFMLILLSIKTFMHATNIFI